MTSVHNPCTQPRRPTYPTASEWRCCTYVLQLPKPTCLESVLCNKRAVPALCSWRKPMRSNEEAAQPNIAWISNHRNTNSDFSGLVGNRFYHCLNSGFQEQGRIFSYGEQMDPAVYEASSSSWSTGKESPQHCGCSTPFSTAAHQKEDHGTANQGAFPSVMPSELRPEEWGQALSTKNSGLGPSPVLDEVIGSYILNPQGESLD
ncbi:hypothetical protein MG293_011324 [Ovis ammon polii]|uniref:Uncharacterized protein n=1 Tax=Ovis ammon polii TaxID=230172 RepID=A0AAD4U2G3_OVIAM|nr:hypothetical protein MG293_011324 [Ovis ammon polii]